MVKPLSIRLNSEYYPVLMFSQCPMPTTHVQPECYNDTQQLNAAYYDVGLTIQENGN